MKLLRLQREPRASRKWPVKSEDQLMIMETFKDVYGKNVGQNFATSQKKHKTARSQFLKKCMLD